MINYAFAGILLFMMFAASVWAQSSPIPQTQSIMIGTVHFGQIVSFSGRAKFYRYSFQIEPRYFDFEGNRCQAVFQERGVVQDLVLEEVQPRLRFIIGEHVINLKDLSRVKWNKTQDGYQFEGKFLVKTLFRANMPLYIQIPHSDSAKLLHLGYQGNSCGVQASALPSSWELNGYDYIDQDQQEFSIQMD